MLKVTVEVQPASGAPSQVVETVCVYVANEVGHLTVYGVTRAGSDQQATVSHRRAEGALRLAWRALGALLEEHPTPRRH